MEQWRKIPGYGPEYEASSYGRVRRLACTYESTFRGLPVVRRLAACTLTPSPSPKGYMRLNIRPAGVVFVHTLVALAFVPNPQNLPQINHRDGVKANNAHSNLEWVTNQQNRDHAVALGLHATGPKPAARKYTPEQVAELVALYQSGLSLHRVGRLAKLMHTTVRSILEREGVRLRGRSEAARLR